MNLPATRLLFCALLVCVCACDNVSSSNARAGKDNTTPTTTSTPNGIQDTIFHELAHVLYRQMPERDAELFSQWSILWRKVIREKRAPEFLYKKPTADGGTTTANYFEEDPNEGFAIAFSYYHTGMKLDAELAAYFAKITQAAQDPQP